MDDHNIFNYVAETNISWDNITNECLAMKAITDFCSQEKTLVQGNTKLVVK